LRAETGFSVSDHYLKYDGEPFEPLQIVDRVRAILAGRAHSLDVTQEEASEIAYHYVRVHLGEDLRPGRLEKAAGNGAGEQIWRIEIVNRDSGEKRGELRVGVETGSTHSWQAIA
jgi:hypothetical protein